MMFYIITENEAYHLEPNRKYQIGSGQQADINIGVSKMYELITEEASVTLAGEKYSFGKHTILCEEKTFTLLLIDNRKYTVCDFSSVYISSNPYSDIIIQNSEVEVTLKENEFFSNVSFYINGKRKNGSVVIKDYDEIVFPQGYVFVKMKQVLLIDSIDPIESKHILLDEIEKEENRTDDFHRSPRIILRQPDDKVTILSPPTEEEANKQSLIKMIIMPLSMIAMTVLMYILSAGGGMILMMLGMSSVTIIMSIQSYFAEKKRSKEKAEKKLAEYINYLDEKSEELHELADEQKTALDYHYPEPKNIIKMAKDVNRRIYEKTPHHFDFLDYQLGKAEIKPSFVIDFNQADMTKYNEEAGNKVDEILKYYRFLKELPLCTDLRTVPVGYIGSRKIVIEQIQQMMVQVAAFQSYHDVTFIPIFREEELPLWNWSRWLPHTMIQALNTRSFIYNQKTRDQILTSLYQMIKDRKMNAQQNSNKEQIYSPHFIFLITDLSLLMDHNIMEYINEDLSKLGISYVFIEEVIESLPEHVKTVVDYKSEKKGVLILQNGEYLNKEFVPMERISLDDKELFSTSLKAVNHVQTMRNSIPNSITFLEMYHAEKVEELNILKRWNQNDTYKTMAVPLGVRGRDELLYLNLHEKAHGPHGLIAGTTGSGKSELIQSYILSLAVNYHPYEVAFLLIDYKGGGMANLFAELPHLVGTITNLDANQSQRALISIKAELKRRQRMFAENDVNHINQYSKLFKQGKVSEPLPHLFLISDEFAELKSEQPDFMKELVSTARIGRSLGIHLILATQKPSGVVDDQIWSNSKFKIALKVQDAADSREVIKTSDAADITLPGRAYLQVGNNELYELFQSAWSGADYYPNGKETRQKSRTIFAIKDNGQYEAINQDLSGLDKSSQIKSLPTELDAVITATKDIFDSLHLPKVKSPWLPPLKETISSEELQKVNFTDEWTKHEDNINVLIGYQDIPEQQLQQPFIFKMNETGHTMVIGSPGYGKSTFLQNFSVDLMRKNTPENVHLYLYDFGTSGLISLADFPHVADYFTLDETEKILKSLRLFQNELKKRKKLIADARMSTLSQYNVASKNPLPYIFVEIDGYDAIAESDISDAFMDTVNSIAREGVSLGIYLVVTALRLSAIRMQLQANFKTKIALYLFDKSDLSGIVGKSNLNMDEIKGRAVIKTEDITYFQVAVPYSAETYLEYISCMKKEANEMCAAWKGKLPSPIPMLPEKVTTALTYEKFVAGSNYPFGLFRESVELASFKFSEAMLFTSDLPNALTHYFKILSCNLKKCLSVYKVVVFDTSLKFPASMFDNITIFTRAVDVDNVTKTLLGEIKERMEKPEEEYQKWLVIIPDVPAFASASQIKESELKTILIESSRVGITPIFISSYQDIITSYDNNAKLVKQLVKQTFIGMRISDQDYMRFRFIPNEPYVKFDEGYIVREEGYEFVKLMNDEIIEN